MSGQNRLILSKCATEGNDENVIREELWDADNEAKSILETGISLKAAKAE